MAALLPPRGASPHQGLGLGVLFLKTQPTAGTYCIFQIVDKAVQATRGVVVVVVVVWRPPVQVQPEPQHPPPPPNRGKDNVQSVMAKLR